MEGTPFHLEDLIALVDRPDGEPLGLLSDAVIMSGRLSGMADEVVDHFVSKAREAGASWSEIGESMGVSKQAAQKRFAFRSPEGRRTWSRGLFTRFGLHARSVVKTAVSHAHELDSFEVGTVHLVLGLTEEEDGAAARAITDLAGSVGSVKEAAVAALGDPKGEPTKRHIPFAADSKKALELSLREALRAKSRDIRTEHILLGLLRDETSDGARLLHRLGVSHRAVDAWLMELQGA